MKFRGLAPVFLLCLTSTARAEPDGNEADSTEVPFKSDWVGNHVQLAVSAAYAAPFGRLSDQFSRTQRAGGGGSFGGDINYGLDRFVVVGAYGGYSVFGSSNQCGDCSASEWGAGLQVGYHLVQGLRIDPWISYGVGWRSLAATSSTEEKFRYGALEWMRLSLGTDWYATPHFAVSPFASFSAASTVIVPGSEAAGRVDMRFSFGLRFVLDLPGRK